MFDWWHERRRDQILEQPFPDAYRNAIERNVKHYGWLDASSQQHLRDLVQVFIAEKSWEGCGGLELTDEMKATIAAQACLLVLALPHRLYNYVDSILVYPSTVLRPAERQGIFTHSRGVIASGPIAIVGEAHVRGPVVLAWDHVLRDGKHPRDGSNVVYHEFAHKLDMLDGRADGTPPLATHEEFARWQRVCEHVFLKLRACTERGEPTFRRLGIGGRFGRWGRRDRLLPPGGSTFVRTMLLDGVGSWSNAAVAGGILRRLGIGARFGR